MGIDGIVGGVSKKVIRTITFSIKYFRGNISLMGNLSSEKKTLVYRR